MHDEDAQSSSVVHQAAEMISLQRACSRADAMEHLEARAAVSRVTVDALANAVVDGTVRFDD